MRAVESRFPPLLFVAGLAGLGYGLVSESGARRLVICAYLVWSLLELPVTFTRKHSATGGRDAGTMQLYGLARVVVVAAGLFLPHTSAWSGWQYAGVVVFLFGVVLRLAAIHKLGRLYSHQVRMLDDHTVVQTGPYHYIRHPAYAGMILAHVGFVSIFPNPFSVGALAVFLVPAIVHRILVEERALNALRGYQEYARRRKRLIPVVW